MAKIKSSKRMSKNAIICKHAAVLFRQKGFKAASMRELADMMHIEAPSLYNHIGSKSEVLQTICLKVAENFNEHLTKIDIPEYSPIKKIELLLRYHIQSMFRSFDEVYVSNHEWKHLPSLFQSEFLAQRKNYESKMVQILKAAIHQKECKKMHPQVTVLTMLAAVRGLEFYQKHKENINQKSIENNIVQHLLKGIIQ